MRMGTMLSAVASWLSFGLVVTSQSQSYTITDLGAPGPPGASSEAHALNADGAVTGVWWPLTVAQTRTFLFAQGTNQDTGLLAGDDANAFAINDARLIVGYSTAAG